MTEKEKLAQSRKIKDILETKYLSNSKLLYHEEFGTERIGFYLKKHKNISFEYEYLNNQDKNLEDDLGKCDKQFLRSGIRGFLDNSSDYKNRELKFDEEGVPPILTEGEDPNKSRLWNKKNI